MYLLNKIILLTALYTFIFTNHLTVVNAFNAGITTFTIGQTETIRWETRVIYNTSITVYLTDGSSSGEKIGTFPYDQYYVTWVPPEGLVETLRGDITLVYYYITTTGGLREGVSRVSPVAVVSAGEIGVDEARSEATGTADAITVGYPVPTVIAPSTARSSFTVIPPTSEPTTITVPTTESTPPPMGIILGSVLGGVGLLGIIGLAALYIWRWAPRSKRQFANNDNDRSNNVDIPIPPPADKSETQVELGEQAAEITCMSELPGDTPARKTPKKTSVGERGIRYLE